MSQQKYFQWVSQSKKLLKFIIIKTIGSAKIKLMARECNNQKELPKSVPIKRTAR